MEDLTQDDNENFEMGEDGMSSEEEKEPDNSMKENSLKNLDYSVKKDYFGEIEDSVKKKSPT